MALRNTGAGIKELRTYGQEAVIRTARSRNNPETGHSQAQIVFLDEDIQDIESQDLLQRSTAHNLRMSPWETSTMVTPEEVIGSSTAITMERVQPDILYS
jgi:hypothetical protein